LRVVVIRLTNQAVAVPLKRLGYVPALDGVRGVAITLVVLFHTFKWPPGGFFGVDVFFVLSGFLITTLLIQEWQGEGRIALRSFYRRRALRLLPALTAMLTAFTLQGLVLYFLGLIGPAVFRRWWISDLSGLLYIQNFVKASASSNNIVGVGQLWSLAAEEQFYIVWPLALILLLRRGSRPRTIAMVAGGAALTVFLHRIELVLTGAPARWIFFSPTSRSDPIMLGCFLGACYAFGLFKSRHLRVAAYGAPIAACAGLVMVISQRNLSTLFPGLLVLELSTGIVLLATLSGSSGIVATGLSWRPLVGLGKISYGIYVWHDLFLGLGRPYLVIPTILIAATLSYEYIEKPFLRRKRSTRIVAPTIPAAAKA
jgi:peptidoglycan/LPS O-acetylase OafA/YrhL